MTDTVAAMMLDMGRRARAATEPLRLAGAGVRSAALTAIASALRDRAGTILAANERDLERARANGLSAALQDRLALTPDRITAIAGAVDEVAAFPDPLGVETARWTRPNGLDIARVRTPLGVLAIIYESRPNVTADAAALCIRSGNVAILRCGSDCLDSALAIHAAVAEGLTSVGLPADIVQLVPTPDRAAVGAILTGLDGTIDLLIPRGGRSLVERVQSEARVPVLGHLEGLNHTYVHAAADPDMARDIVVNAKMRRVSVCGATETLLIDAAVAPTLLPVIAGALTATGCVLRGDDAARAILPGIEVADAADWTTEYLAPILSVRVVDGIEQAVDHIRTHGSGHTDAIVTEDADTAAAFLNAVDSAIVIWNASTQFADGGEFGFGGEIGISTARLHARGPVGAEQLTSYKYVVRGTGQVRP
ncbi:glutamate-5-semialdehyde dehydrogenase [Brevundimonas variabilis]|uniref:Gamma-glutamyl phosphate reductase n=1 Tax=Brevundimonas variabilis TaxID=74312 RepID=A0A7W9CJL7_9CAUL|nr:glutamate-5-semialdehyde dehydrogenase [Brevundimonas variabilis]MBB5746761.1 glutamate-5-semialdehyde dehydrogenase [Brevundimonas variabilis]